MFYKFASNILKDLANECEIKSFNQKDLNKKYAYNKIYEKIQLVLEKIVEK